MLVCCFCRLELQNLQLTHRAQRAESELSDLRSFLSQFLATTPPPVISQAAALSAPISPAAAVLATSSCQAAATPPTMTQPAAAPASSLPADAGIPSITQAAASPAVLSHAAAAAPPPFMSQFNEPPHGMSQAAATELPYTKQPLPAATGSLSLLPDSPLKRKSSLRRPEAPAGTVGLSVPDRSAPTQTGFNPLLGIEVTPIRSSDGNGSGKQSSDNASQLPTTAGHTHRVPSPTSGRPSALMGMSSIPMGSSNHGVGSSNSPLGGSNPLEGTPVQGKSSPCKSAVTGLQPIGSPRQLEGKLSRLASQVPALLPPTSQPGDHSYQSTQMQEQCEQDTGVDQLNDNEVPMRHQEHHIGDAAPESGLSILKQSQHAQQAQQLQQTQQIQQTQQAQQSQQGHQSQQAQQAYQSQQAQQEQQAAQAPSVSLNHSVLSMQHGHSILIDCSTDSSQQANRRINTSAVDRHGIAEAASMQIPAAAKSMPAVAAAPSREALQSAVCVNEPSVARQQPVGLAALAAAITNKHQPETSETISEGCGPQTDAPMPCALAGTHSLMPRAGRQAATPAVGNVSTKAADIDTVTCRTNTTAESAAVVGSFRLAADHSPSCDDGASQKEMSHTAAELFCMLSDRDSQDVANSQDVGSTPPQGKSLHLDACSNQAPAVDMAEEHPNFGNMSQLEPSVSQHSEPLTVSAQHLASEQSLAVLPQPTLPTYKQDVQCAARPAVIVSEDAPASEDQALKQSDGQEKENRPMAQSAMALGGL